MYVGCVLCVCTVVGMCSSTCTPCTAFRMSARITCWYLVLVPLLYSASLGQPNAGKCAWFALPLVQFAWVSRALNILARVGASFVQGKCA